jgi:hypothetical protein
MFVRKLFAICVFTCLVFVVPANAISRDEPVRNPIERVIRVFHSFLGWLAHSPLDDVPIVPKP